MAQAESGHTKTVSWSMWAHARSASATTRGRATPSTVSQRQRPLRAVPQPRRPHTSQEGEGATLQRRVGEN